MRIVQVNLGFDPALREPGNVLEAYHTLTGWSHAMASAGAAVQTLQRFTADAQIVRQGVTYDFVHDGSAGTPSSWVVFPRVVEAVARAAADVIHINGLMFPAMVKALRDACPSSCIVLQDHSGRRPRALPWPLSVAQRRRWQRAFRAADACSFTACEMASSWHASGLPPEMTVLELHEASTTLRRVPREDARAITGMSGSPCVLWVGRLDRNKDPETVLIAVESVLSRSPAMQMTMIVPADADRARVVHMIDASDVLRRRTTMIGPIPHRQMDAYYSSADIFISGSHYEGSGYALIEAMACGLVPCVTNIPAFRALTGGVGALWRPGDASDARVALEALLQRNLDQERTRVLQRFQRALTWEVLGRETVAAYSRLVQSRRAHA